MKVHLYTILCTCFLLATPVFGEAYSVMELEGEVHLDRPGQAQVKMDKTSNIAMWDRISTPEKSKFKLQTNNGTVLEFSKNSLMQFVPCPCSNELRLRLLKGRVRIENSAQANFKMQTLNSELKIPFGKTDIIISAMNTLVAPREGKMVKVGTKKVSKSVGTGFYGLVMSDGTFIKTAAAQQKSQDEKKGEGK
jgi:hypothetical protein